MKTKPLVFLFVILATFALVASAFAVFCTQCGTDNPDDAKFCSKCGAKVYHPPKATDTPPKVTDIYAQTSDLIEAERYSEAIAFLDKYSKDYRRDPKATVLLARAYLGKCNDLKEKGDPSYKTLVFTPYDIGKQLITQYSHTPKYLSQGWYIAGHAVLINDRAKKAIKYIEKAIQISPSPTSEVHYYFVLADAYAEVANTKQMKSASSKMPSEYYEAEKKYRDIINMDTSNNRKGLAYYKLAVLYSDFRQEKKAKESLKTALTLAEKEALILRIRRILKAEKRILLRATPKLVSDIHIAQMLKEYNFYDDELNFLGSFANDFVNNGDGTITDKATGLMWQKSGSSRAKTWKRARTYVKQLNKGFAGYSDWRLPTVEELASLLRKDENNGIHTDPLFDKKQKSCWSSDKGPPRSSTSPHVWHVNFREGSLGLTVLPLYPGAVPTRRYVRAVRLVKKSAQVKPSGKSSGEQEGRKLVRQKVEKGSLRKVPKQLLERDIRRMVLTYDFYDGALNLKGSSDNDFVDNGDGTITDNRTGLMWQKSGSSRVKTWKRARTYVKRLNKGFAGYSDWRLPTIDELASLVEREKVNGVHIDPIFYNKQKSCWSSDKGPPFGGLTANPPQVWHVNFREGSLGLTILPIYSYETITHRYVRAVRSLR
jgi:tetratricopeptide (TPR) repeat protein